MRNIYLSSCLVSTVKSKFRFRNRPRVSDSYRKHFRLMDNEEIRIEELVPWTELMAEPRDPTPPLIDLSWDNNLLSRLESFRVQQLFLIYNDGRLISHVTSGSRDSVDREMFSSMLTAIQEYMAESVHSGGEGDHLESLKMGDFNLHLQTSELLFIVAVVDGKAPQNFHKELKDFADDLFEQYQETLTQWDGDATQLELASIDLKEFLDYWSH